MVRDNPSHKDADVIPFPVDRVRYRQRSIEHAPGLVHELRIKGSHSNPSIITELIQQGYEKNSRDDDTPQYRMSLSPQSVRVIEAVYLLLLPDLTEDEKADIKRIQGIKMPGTYPFPLVLPGCCDKEYGLKYDFLEQDTLRMKLEVASPRHDLESFLRREGDLPQSVDAVMITSATPQGYRGKQGKKVFYLPSIAEIESVHPSSANMLTRVEIGYRRRRGLSEGVERMFTYNANINSL